MPDALRGEGAIAMVTGRYPGTSFTFIDREVCALREMGVDILTVTVRSPDRDSLSGPFQQAEAGRVIRLLASAMSPTHLLRSVLLSVRHPRRLVGTVRLALETCPKGVRGTALQLAYFFEAVLLARHLRDRNVTHIHNHLGDSSGTVVMLASELTEIPFSLTLHGPEIFQSAHFWRLDEKIARARGVACISQFCRSQAMLFSDAAHWHKLAVVRCGVDPSLYRTESNGRSGRDLLFVGRLEERKGVDSLLEAIALLCARGADVHLTIVGNGSQRVALQRKSAVLKLGKVVTFAESKDEAGVAEALRHADLLIVPSLSEGLPVVIMEALASRVPVVATAVDGIPELVRDGETGRLVQPSDPQGIAGAIEQLLSDPNMRQRMGDAGQKLVSADYDAHRNSRGLLSLIAPNMRAGGDAPMHSQLTPLNERRSIDTLLPTANSVTTT